ncbi:MAG: hypothetical protein ACTHK0_16740 [Ginsengibacter sp.]
MLDEENDKRIKEAADHYHPEYDDTAWQKMDQLLNEHLPPEKERKRFLFLLPLVLFIGCLLLLIGIYHSKNNKTGSSQNDLIKNKTEKPIVTNARKNSEIIATPTFIENKKNAAITNEKKGIEKNNTTPVQEKSVTGSPVSSSVNDKNENTIADDSPNKQNDQINQHSVEKTNNSPGINHEENSVSNNSIHENKSNVLTSDVKKNNADKEKSTPQKENFEQNNLVKTEKVASQNPSKKTNKTTGHFARNFGISLSAGPDISAVHANKIGKVTLAYGAGFSYAISKKLNLRTGFYLSKKIYSVDGDDYKIPTGSLGNYEYLENVDANCKVYEIPVRIDYSFRKTKNHNWFISGGLSSYLMKRETYDYYYKTPAGEMYNKDWSISNKNKHFFSVLDVSGGYQYSLNKQFSIIAEPYINVPLTGIGAGKVKLNSGGILFTIKAKPFLKD